MGSTVHRLTFSVHYPVVPVPAAHAPPLVMLKRYAEIEAWRERHEVLRVMAYTADHVLPSGHGLRAVVVQGSACSVFEAYLAPIWVNSQALGSLPVRSWPWNAVDRRQY